MKLVVLAAGPGTRLRPMTDDRPKAMVPFLGRPILDWTLDAARECGLAGVTVVGGYKHESLSGRDARLIKSLDYTTTGMVGTLMAADQDFGEGFVVGSGHIVFRPSVLRALLASTAEVGVVVDLDWLPYWQLRFRDPLADAESLRMTPDGTVRSIGQTVMRMEDIQAQFIGLAVFRGRGVKALRRAWIRAKGDADYRRPILGHRTMLAKLTLADVLDEMTSGDVPVKAIPIRGGWVEIDSPGDIPLAEERWNSTASADPVVVDPGAGSETGGSAAGPTYGPAPIFRPARPPRRW